MLLTPQPFSHPVKWDIRAYLIFFGTENNYTNIWGSLLHFQIKERKFNSPSSLAFGSPATLEASNHGGQKIQAFVLLSPLRRSLKVKVKLRNSFQPFLFLSFLEFCGHYSSQKGKLVPFLLVV